MKKNEKQIKQKVAYYMSMLNAASYFYNAFCNDEEKKAIKAEYDKVMREQAELQRGAAEQNEE